MMTVTVIALGLVCDAVIFFFKFHLQVLSYDIKSETNIVWQKIFNLDSLLNVTLK